MKLINKVNVGLKSLCLQVYYSLINNLSKRKVSFSESSHLSISLTSYGKRISKVYLTIESIIAQSEIDILSITLWLSVQDIDRTNLPSSLLRLEKRGVKIKFVDENIKSYKKIYYEYIQRKDHPAAIIVTADDDVFYPQGWLKQLYLGFLENKQLVTCFRGHFITVDSSNSFCKYSDWTDEFQPDKHELLQHKALLPTGVGGVLYPISSLMHLDQNIDDVLDNCPNADDIWLKLICIKNGYGAKRVVNRNTHFLPVLSLQMKGLELYNVLQGGNDIQFKKSSNFFGLSVKDFK
ncbi:MAG: hypothetical protein MJK12_08250 [Colwellia sp.]|nr:hypothetical protein [Colwellia sp.]